MATYPELFNLFNDSSLRNRVAVACIIAADGILNQADPAPANQAARETWAVGAFSNPMGVAQEMLMALLAGNNALEVAQITGATDAQVQAKVDAAVDLFSNNLA